MVFEGCVGESSHLAEAELRQRQLGRGGVVISLHDTMVARLQQCWTLALTLLPAVLAQRAGYGGSGGGGAYEAELLVLSFVQEALDQPEGAARRAAHGQEDATCHEHQPDEVRRTHGSSRNQLLHRGGGDERARSHRELGQSEASTSLDDTHPQQQGATDEHAREQPVRIPI